MFLKLIIPLALFVVLSIYFMTLNPGDVLIHMTQAKSITVPLMHFMMGSVFVGVLITLGFSSLLQFKNNWKSFLLNRKVKKEDKIQKKSDKLFQKVESALALGQKQKAVSILKDILEANPKHVPALYQLGVHHRQKGNFEQALKCHQRAIASDPESSSALEGLADDFSAAGLPEREIEALRRLLLLNKSSLKTLRKLRDAYLKAGDVDSAYKTQKSLLPLVQDKGELARENDLFSQIAYNKGLIYYHQGDLDQAITEFKKSLKENDQSLPSYISLGDLYAKRKNTKLAIKTWSEGFEATRSSLCLQRMQYLFEKMGEPEEANKRYHYAISSSSGMEKENLVMIYSSVLITQGKAEEAKELLQSVPQKHLFLELLLAKAHYEGQNHELGDEAMKKAYETVHAHLLQFTCETCHENAPQWTAICPACNSWDSLSLGTSKMATPLVEDKASQNLLEGKTHPQITEKAVA